MKAFIWKIVFNSIDELIKILRSKILRIVLSLLKEICVKRLIFWVGIGFCCWLGLLIAVFSFVLQLFPSNDILEKHFLFGQLYFSILVSDSHNFLDLNYFFVNFFLTDFSKKFPIIFSYLFYWFSIFNSFRFFWRIRRSLFFG